MTYTLKELAVAALKYLDIKSDDTSIASGGLSYDSYVSACEWANLAAAEIADFGPWPWLTKAFHEVTFAVDEYIADLPSDVHRLLTDPSYEDYSCLFEPATLQQIQELRAGSTSSGTPYVVGMAYNERDQKHQLVIWPPAGDEKTFNIAYARHFPEMEGDDEKPSMPQNLHRICLTGTLAYAEEHGERNWDSGARKAFNGQLADAWTKASATVGAAGIKYLRRHNHFGMAERLITESQDVTIET